MKKSAQRNLADRIADLRKSLKLSQTAFARETGISLRHVQEIEAGKVDIRLSTLERIASVFRIHPYQLLYDATPENDGQYACGLKFCRPVPILPLDSFPLALQITDRNGLILYENPRCLRIRGYTQAEVINVFHVWDYYPDNKSKEDLKKYWRYLLKERPDPTPYIARNTTKDGRLLNVRVDWNYIFGLNNKVQGFFSVLDFD